MDAAEVDALLNQLRPFRSGRKAIWAERAEPAPSFRPDRALRGCQMPMMLVHVGIKGLEVTPAESSRPERANTPLLSSVALSERRLCPARTLLMNS